MLNIINISKRTCPSFNGKYKIISKIWVAKVEAITFKIIKTKEMIGVGVLESKRGILPSFSHLEPCVILSSHMDPKW